MQTLLIWGENLSTADGAPAEGVSYAGIIDLG